MSRDHWTREMIRFLTHKILHDPDYPLDEDTPLVSTGLVDSFALVDVLAQLERVTGRRIPPGKVAPQDFETVRSMVETVIRVGSPTT